MLCVLDCVLCCRHCHGRRRRCYYLLRWWLWHRFPPSPSPSPPPARAGLAAGRASPSEALTRVLLSPTIQPAAGSELGPTPTPSEAAGPAGTEATGRAPAFGHPGGAAGVAARVGVSPLGVVGLESCLSHALHVTCAPARHRACPPACPPTRLADLPDLPSPSRPTPPCPCSQPTRAACPTCPAYRKLRHHDRIRCKTASARRVFQRQRSAVQRG